MKRWLWTILAVLPLPAQAQDIQDVLLVRIVSDPGVISRRAPLLYPREAMQSLVQGTVVVNATVDARGRISGVSVVSGPALLRDAVAASVKQWEFVPGPAGERQVSVEFRIPGLDAVTLEARSKQMEAQIKGPRPPRRPLAGRTVKNVMFLGVPEDARDEALSRLNIRVGDVLSNEGMDRGEGELRKYDSKIQFKVLSIGEADAEIILFRETARK